MCRCLRAGVAQPNQWVSVRAAPCRHGGAEVWVGTPLGLGRLLIGLRGVRASQVVLRLAATLSAGLEHVPVTDPHDRPAGDVLDQDDGCARGQTVVKNRAYASGSWRHFVRKQVIRATISLSCTWSCM